MQDQDGNILNRRKSPYIPEDSESNRKRFLAIKGMDKYLGRQFAAMCDREEIQLMHDNLGRSSDR